SAARINARFVMLFDPGTVTSARTGLSRGAISMRSGKDMGQLLPCGRRVRARGLHATVSRVPSRGAIVLIKFSNRMASLRRRGPGAFGPQVAPVPGLLEEFRNRLGVSSLKRAPEIVQAVGEHHQRSGEVLPVGKRDVPPHL